MTKTALAIATVALSFATTALADDKSHGHIKDYQAMPMMQHDDGMTEGQIKRISKGSNKLTIKHGQIQNLDMPPMTMVFSVADEKMLETLKKGDNVKFKVEMIDDNMVITEISPQ